MQPNSNYVTSRYKPVDNLILYIAKPVALYKKTRLNHTFLWYSVCASTTKHVVRGKKSNPHHCNKKSLSVFRYNVVQHCMVFHTPLHWLTQNINQTLNSQKTLHISPSRASVYWENLGGNWPQCIGITWVAGFGCAARVAHTCACLIFWIIFGRQLDIQCLCPIVRVSCRDIQTTMNTMTSWHGHIFCITCFLPEEPPVTDGLPSHWVRNADFRSSSPEQNFDQTVGLSDLRRHDAPVKLFSVHWTTQRVMHAEHVDGFELRKYVMKKLAAPRWI